MIVIHEMSGGVHHVGSLLIAAAVKPAGNNVWRVSDIGEVTLDWTVSKEHTVTRSATKWVTKVQEVTKGVSKHTTKIVYATRAAGKTCTKQASFFATNVPTRMRGITCTVEKAVPTLGCVLNPSPCANGNGTMVVSGMTADWCKDWNGAYELVLVLANWARWQTEDPAPNPEGRVGCEAAPGRWRVGIFQGDPTHFSSVDTPLSCTPGANIATGSGAWGGGQNCPGNFTISA